MAHYLIDDRSLDDLIYASTAFDGGLAPAVAQRGLEDTAFGPPRFASRHRLAGRTLTIAVDVRPATLALRTETLDAIARRLSGVRAYSVADAPDRVWYGELSGIRARPTAVNSGNPLTLLELDISVPDPRRVDRDEQVRALSTTPVACPVGTGVSAPRLALFGAATPVVDPVVVLRSPGGVELGRLTLSGSLGTNQWLDIDCGPEWLHLVDAGDRVAALAYFGSGAFPLLDGSDAADVGGPYPTLALSATSGTPTGVVRWRRSWL